MHATLPGGQTFLGDPQQYGLQGWQQGGWQQAPYGLWPGGFGQRGQLEEIAQIVSTVTPIVASLLQARSYQGHFGQFMPRAA